MFDPAVCSGVDLADNRSEFDAVISGVSRLNQQLRLQVTMENVLDEGISTDITFHVVILARKATDDLTAWQTIADEVRARPIMCSKELLGCDPFYLIQITFLEFNDYDFHVCGFFFFSFSKRASHTHDPQKKKKNQRSLS